VSARRLQVVPEQLVFGTEENGAAPERARTAFPPADAKAYSPQVLTYFAAHAIDPAVAEAAGVTGAGDDIAYPYIDADGRYMRVRKLGGDAKTRQPRGRPLAVWWPGGRPERAETVFVAEGESDALAALTAAGDASLHPAAADILGCVRVAAVPGASFPTDRLVTELVGLGVKRAVLALDADAAGNRFAERAAEALSAAGIASARLPLPEGRDLADCLAATAVGERGERLANMIADLDYSAQSTSTASPSNGRELVAESYAAIPTERPRWAWAGRIPLGAPTLLVGREKLGKSTLTCALAAGVSRGTLPGDLHGEPASVLLLSYEDHAASTVKPRLRAAGADPRLVYRVSASRDGAGDLVSLPNDVDAIGAIVAEHGCRLVIVDPFSAALSGEINSHRDQDMRRAIAALSQLAERADAALLLVAHFNKAAGGDALTRVLGSRGLTAAARSVLVFGRAPDAEDGSPDRVLAHAACNVAPEAPSLTCRIEPQLIDGDAGPIETSRLQFIGDCDTHADDLLATRGEDERSDRDIAAEWLADELADGEWHPARETKTRAKADGIAERTLQRALKHLCVEHRRGGFPAVSEWRLPVAPTPPGANGATGTGATGAARTVEPKTPDLPPQSRQCSETGATGVNGHHDLPAGWTVADLEAVAAEHEDGAP
jgi:AAA domain-containing protein/Toprim domain-containing protein